MYQTRANFRANTARAHRALYRGNGTLSTVGNVCVPLFAGRAVGGSTVINSGTCFRTPSSVLETWQRRFGLPSDFSPAGLAPYFEQVEAMLSVQPASPQHLGAIAPIIGPRRPTSWVVSWRTETKRSALRWAGGVLLRMSHGSEALDRRQLCSQRPSERRRARSHRHTSRRLTSWQVEPAESPPGLAQTARGVSRSKRTPLSLVVARF